MGRLCVLGFVMTAVLFSGPICAAPPDVDVVIARGCGNEPYSRARCVRDLANARIADVEERIAESTSGLQAADARSLRKFEKDLRGSQRAWLARVAKACDDLRPPLARQRCRLEAALLRDEQVRAVLARAIERLGGSTATPYDPPGSVRIFVPLPDVPGGPAVDGVDLGLEWDVPLNPP